MKSTKTFLFAVAAIGFILGSSAQAYLNVIDLGTLGGRQSCAYSINENGQIVGWAANSSGYRRACLFDPTGNGANTNLGVLGDSYTHSAASAINGNSQIVGVASINNPIRNRACLFDNTGNGANKDLGTLGGTTSWANSISNGGQIVGWANNTSGNYRACLFDATGHGANTDLGTLGSNDSWAESINDNGQIVGHAYTSASAIRACLFDPTGGGANIDLGTLGGGGSQAFSINESSQIVGWAYNSSGYHRACLFDSTGGGANKDLGSIAGYNYSFAECINDNGQIVGEAMISDYSTYHACLFDPTGQGRNVDLNALIDPSLGWTLSFAYGINNNGWIEGQGIHNGQTRAFLLIPEPATLLIFGLGSLAAMRRRRA
jgi:probable HAF family extracellular repeat protein